MHWSIFPAGGEEMIGKNVKYLREQRALSQAELGQAAGTNQSTIHRIEQDDHDPKLSTVLAVARGLGVSILELIERSDKGDERP
jgi:transcriptional regulator with XRE-family HTH domain